MNFYDFKIILICISVSSLQSQRLKNTGFVHYDELIVTLDPYVSILDKYNLFRYNASQLYTQVALAATEFSRFHVQFSVQDLTEGLPKTSLSLLPSVIAHYNLNISKSQHVLEVWLSLSEDVITSPDALHSLSHRLSIVAKETNAIYDQTVTTILLPVGLFTNQEYTAFKNVSSHFPNLRYGIIYNLQDYGFCSSSRVLKNLQKFSANTLILKFPPVFTIYPTITDFFTKANQSMYQCRYSDNLKLGLITSYPDTCDKGLVDYTRLYHGWVSIREWLSTLPENHTVMMDKAFDTPYENLSTRKTAGWWRYFEGNSSFQAKKDIYVDVDGAENNISFARLEAPSTFKGGNIGAVFSLHQDFSQRLYDDEVMGDILNIMCDNFDKITILFDDDDRHRPTSILKELRSLSNSPCEMDFSAVLMPNVNIKKFFRGSIEETARQYQVAPNLVKTFILPYTGLDTEKLTNLIKTSVLSDRNKSSYELGFAFPISTCFYKKSNIKLIEKELITKLIQSSDTVYFYFEEDPGTVNLGATRMVSQRITVLESCRRMLEGLNKTEKQTGFLMYHYHVVSLTFYNNAWALYNFVVYWEMLVEWALDTQVTLIMSGVLDSSRILPKSGKRHVRTLGWWREQTNGYEHADNFRDDFFVSKKVEALRLAWKQFPPAVDVDEGFLGTREIILVSVIPVLLCVVFSGLILGVMRRHYQKEVLLSKLELEEFFNGSKIRGGPGDGDGEDGEGTAHNLPYDKNRYEIPATGFTVDETAVLGQGEYGRVVRGKIERDGKFVNVAIKMVNMAKVRKTALNDLLTEIKVLAYLDKHENIVELLGAYTTDLKRGRVYVFLELCPLGSLEKYLRNLRPPITEEVDGRGKEVESSSEYINLVEKSDSLLDPSVTQDLFRWGHQIAGAMSYLTVKRVVHADLATRNILLDFHRNAKVSDFGLSRRIYNYANYVKQQQEPLPWRWMPPESLRLLQFNEKTDVWAYGVTLWEMFSLGDQPYPGLHYDSNFPQMLERGFRLSQPKYVDTNTYALMKKCWTINPAGRPSFANLVGHFADYAEVQ